MKKGNVLKKIFLENNIVHKFFAIFIYFFVVYVARNWIASLVKLTSITDTNILNIIYEWLIYSILFIFVVLSLLPDIKEEFNKYKEKKVKSYFVEVLIGIGLAYVLMVVGNMLTNLTSSASNSENEMAIDSLVLSSYGVTLIPVICIIGPIVEELVYRVAIEGSLIKLHIHPIVSIIISGVLFGFIHVVDAGDYGQIWPYLFLGIMLGATYYKTKSIYTNIFIHICLNSLSTGIQYAIVLFAIICKKLGIPII